MSLGVRLSCGTAPHYTCLSVTQCEMYILTWQPEVTTQPGLVHIWFQCWVSTLVHLLCITQALVTNVQYICQFHHQIIIAKKKSFHALASHTSPGNIMGCAFNKKQQDVGIREEVGGNERNELVMFFKHVPLKCCWLWSVCIHRWRY